MHSVKNPLDGTGMVPGVVLVVGAGTNKDHFQSKMRWIAVICIREQICIWDMACPTGWTRTDHKHICVRMGVVPSQALHPGK